MAPEVADALWFATSRETACAPRLSGELKADLVVIGGGFTGLSAALHGALAGATVALVEANTFGHGGSGRNVGLANAGLWLPPEEIKSRLGDTAGTHLTALLGAAPDVVFDLIDRFEIACEPVRNGTLHCAHAPAGMRDLGNRHAQWSALGAPVKLLTRAEAVDRVGSDQVHGALFDPRAGTIQPLAFARGLARAAMQAGAHLFEGSPVTEIRREGDSWCVQTPGGYIEARALILATNAYHQPIQGGDSPRIVPVHYFQAATAPLPDDLLRSILPGKEGCWDSALVMSSWRLDAAGRLVIGAMGALDHVASGAHRHWLDRKLARMFPALAGSPLRHVWAGRIAMTAEYLPKILSTGPDALTIFGYSGRGIGPGTVFGQRMAEALVSGDPSRLPVVPVATHSLPFAGLRQAWYEGGATLTHLIKDRI